jgi:hypothetical protein
VGAGHGDPPPAVQLQAQPAAGRAGLDQLTQLAGVVDPLAVDGHDRVAGTQDAGRRRVGQHVGDPDPAAVDRHRQADRSGARGRGQAPALLEQLPLAGGIAARVDALWEDPAHRDHIPVGPQRRH